MKRLRVYVDTSVIGGCLDDEFAEDSNRLMDAVRQGRLTLLVSAVVSDELADAPPEVPRVLADLPSGAVVEVPLTAEVVALREAYLRARVLDARWGNDALHVAAATVHRADAIVSWNFKHIVRLDKMKAYNRVNLLQGYGSLTIVTPREVAGYDSVSHGKEV